MKKIIWVVAVIAVISAGFYLNPDPGKKEFKKQLEALDSVRSWKMDLQVGSNGRLLVRRGHEAQCPDMEHISEYGIESTGEFVRMANLVYYRKNNGAWVQDANTPQDLFVPIVTPRPCMSNPGGTKTSPDSGDTEWRTELNRAIKDGTFIKGEVDTVNGTACRNWQVSWMNARNQMVAYTMCISEQDHLPRRMQLLKDNVNMYFTWNVPVEITAPDTTSTTPTGDSPLGSSF